MASREEAVKCELHRIIRRAAADHSAGRGRRLRPISPTRHASCATAHPEYSRRVAVLPSDLGLLRDRQGIVDFSVEVTDRQLQVRMPNRSPAPLALRLFVDQRCLRQSHRRCRRQRIHSGRDHSLFDDPCALSGGYVRRVAQPASKEEVLRFQLCLRDPGRNCGSRRLGQFKLHLPVRYFLNDRRGSGRVVRGTSERT